MDKLSDQMLLDTYATALRQGLDHAFIKLLLAEIRRRGLSLPHERTYRRSRALG
ncbi:sporulation histidine kinase inhibitor Sda [Paenibacillus sp. YYML68]|uniref:sporulation histidine kinase inhibitor Sda n=1 Tax=Paenibacillus sp. YYML68 TaxID=2909250 RepID=UPI00248F686F|nr:sporulation histidine kinase inhibitor Sda [Paenibacillus sp. YYML68]